MFLTNTDIYNDVFISHFWFTDVHCVLNQTCVLNVTHSITAGTDVHWGLSAAAELNTIIKWSAGHVEYYINQQQYANRVFIGNVTNGDMSLIIHNVRAEDEKQYFLYISTLMRLKQYDMRLKTYSK